MSFDDETATDLKVRYANHYNLKGAFVWEVDTDNFLGLFNHPKFTITRTIAEALKKGDGLKPEEIFGHANQNMACQPQAQLCNPNDTTIPTLPTFIPTTTLPVTTTTPTEHDCDEVGCKADGDLKPYPGDCHRYYKCVYSDSGVCHLEAHTCDTWWFDPWTLACAWEPLPGLEDLCQ